MSEPVIFISHFKVKEGKLDPLKRLAGEVGSRILAERPVRIPRRVPAPAGNRNVST